MRDSSLEIRKISKYFYQTFLINSEKCEILKKEKMLPLKLKKVPRKDQYLFQILQAIPDGVLVTTDEKLLDFKKFGYKIDLREDFLKAYLGRIQSNL